MVDISEYLDLLGITEGHLHGVLTVLLVMGGAMLVFNAIFRARGKSAFIHRQGEFRRRQNM